MGRTTRGEGGRGPVSKGLHAISLVERRRSTARLRESTTRGRPPDRRRERQEPGPEVRTPGPRAGPSREVGREGREEGGALVRCRTEGVASGAPRRSPHAGRRVRAPGPRDPERAPVDPGSGYRDAAGGGSRGGWERRRSAGDRRSADSAGGQRRTPARAAPPSRGARGAARRKSVIRWQKRAAVLEHGFEPHVLSGMRKIR